MALRSIPQGWRLHWAPRAMRATILAANGNPLIAMQPESAEGRHQFGDWATLMQHAPHPDMRAALADLVEWAAQQGGYEAECWARAKALLHPAQVEG